MNKSTEASLLGQSDEASLEESIGTFYNNNFYG